MAMVTNVEVLTTAGVERFLMKRMRRRQLNFLGHIVSAEELEIDNLYFEDLTEHELKEDSRRNTWAAFRPYLVEGRRPRACGDR